MDSTKALLLILHVAAAALAFGASLAPSAMLRRARAVGPEALIAATREYCRQDLIGAIGGVAVFATGLALIFTGGGFAAYPPQYHAAMSLVLLMIGLGFLFLRPLGKRLVAAAEARDDSATTKLIKRVAMGAGMMQLLWLTTLVLMFVRYF